MSDEQERPAADEGAGEREPAREEAARRRRRAEVFGEVLPESTTDDRDPAGRPGEGSSDEWLRRNVPPHHG
ncbi:hypothetical protein [Nocardioides caldifontis]|uniref:hypothetical protein n=1 Tax=Nocardioides caldifontis TaxID=2588938 RepID=UPI0011DF5276|nr:hypothetical protein [Nocardioides caldifontis]